MNIPNRIFIKLLIIISLCLTTQAFYAQESTPSDSVSNSTVIKKKSPLKASLMSAVIPGAGQIYNQKYWKAPVVWVGLGTFTYFAYFNHQEFNRYRSAYLTRQDDKIDEFYDVLTYDALENEMDRWRSYRDWNLIGVTLLYILQIVDANVDASLCDFDVSDDISLRLATPVVTTSVLTQPTMGLTLSLRF